MRTSTIPALRLNNRDLADVSYCLALRAANLQNSSPKVSKRLWKLYDRLINFGEAVAAKKSK
jgi:hypothetical protein